MPEHFHNWDENVLVINGSAVASSDTDGLHTFWTYASVDADRTIVPPGVATRVDEVHGTSVK